MRIASILQNDFANGPGIRTTIFVTGCTRNCLGCHNPELHSFIAGVEFTDNTVNQILELLTANGIQRGLTILGGEPCNPSNINEVTRLCRIVKEKQPDCNIWVYTGYQYSDLKGEQLLKYVDTIVDGPFDITKTSGYHPWRGSSNQRIVNLI